MLPRHNAETCYTTPTRIHGIPELAFLISTDEEFSVFRSFSELSSRNLLNMQTELMRIDTELRRLDRASSHNTTEEEQIVQNARKEMLLSTANIMLERYHAALIKHKKVLKMESPPTKMIKEFDSWIHRAVNGKSVGQKVPETNESLVHTTEAENRYWRMKDYVVLKPLRSDSIVERFTRDYLGWILQQHPPVPPTWSVYYFSRSKVERIKDWLAFPLASLFLIAPALLFHYICDGNKRLAVLLSFIIGLAFVVQIFMGTSRKQTLGVALAYTGVMSILLNSATQASNCKA